MRLRYDASYSLKVSNRSALFVHFRSLINTVNMFYLQLCSEYILNLNVRSNAFFSNAVVLQFYRKLDRSPYSMFVRHLKALNFFAPIKSGSFLSVTSN